LLAHLCFCFFSSDGPHRHLHSFPTRRSSDLALQAVRGPEGVVEESAALVQFGFLLERQKDGDQGLAVFGQLGPKRRQDLCPRVRSEEHTSELQSRFDLVCRLLLEKKKKIDIY